MTNKKIRRILVDGYFGGTGKTAETGDPIGNIIGTIRKSGIGLIGALTEGDVGGLVTKAGNRNGTSREGTEGTHRKGSCPCGSNVRTHSIHGTRGSGTRGSIGDGTSLSKIAGESTSHSLWMCSKIRFMNILSN